MKNYTAILVMLTAFTFNAQTDDERYSKFSLEGGLGIHVPFSPADQIERSNYTGLGHVQVGVRYMFCQPYGVRAKYSYEGFRDSSKNQGLDIHSFSADFVINLGRLTNLNLYPRMNESLALMAHAGAGLAIASPKQSNISEKLGSFNIGLRPMVRLNNRFSMYGDFTYTMTIKQQYLYNGNLYSSDFQDFSGSFASFSLGFAISLGENPRHIDWK